MLNKAVISADVKQVDTHRGRFWGWCTTFLRLALKGAKYVWPLVFLQLAHLPTWLQEIKIPD